MSEYYQRDMKWGCPPWFFHKFYNFSMDGIPYLLIASLRTCLLAWSYSTSDSTRGRRDDLDVHKLSVFNICVASYHFLSLRLYSPHRLSILICHDMNLVDIVKWTFCNHPIHFNYCTAKLLKLHYYDEIIAIKTWHKNPWDTKHKQTIWSFGWKTLSLFLQAS